MADCLCKNCSAPVFGPGSHAETKERVLALEKKLGLLCEHLGLDFESGLRIKKTRPDYGPAPIHATDTAQQ